jgi:hypothetical protein
VRSRIFCEGELFEFVIALGDVGAVHVFGLMRKSFDFSATLRSLRSYIGPSITTVTCIFLFYVLVPVIVIFIATSSIADKELKALLRSEIIGCYSILISFGAMYSLPLLVIERRLTSRMC